MTDEAEVLAATSRGSVIAAAGCGKTELIVRAVKASKGRQLVFTHTNAGVETLRRRLRRLGIGEDRVFVDTIASWCLRYIASYPSRSGGIPVGKDGGTDWARVSPAMADMLADQLVQRIIKASYTGVYVDEYQDCDRAQHHVVSRLSEHLPVRILGDPLQAVFDFGDPLPDWELEVEAAFPRTMTLSTPWRWIGKDRNRELGSWLEEVRKTLEQGRSVDLRDKRISYVQATNNGAVEATKDACMKASGEGGSIVAISKFPADRDLIAKTTGGLFQSVESIDCRDGRLRLDLLAKTQVDGRGKIHSCYT